MELGSCVGRGGVDFLEGAKCAHLLALSRGLEESGAKIEFLGGKN